MKSIKQGININSAITGIIALIVLFLVIAQLYPEFADAGDSLNSSGIPLGSFFVNGGIITLLLAVGLFYMAYKHFMSK
jgi:high-affinity Fe2+/Pb2+ permease